MPCPSSTSRYGHAWYYYTHATSATYTSVGLVDAVLIEFVSTYFIFELPEGLKGARASAQGAALKERKLHLVPGFYLDALTAQTRAVKKLRMLSVEGIPANC